jgi:hypothetical protein
LKEVDMPQIEWVKKERGTCGRWEDVPKGAVVEQIDCKYVIDKCVSCGKYICEGDEHEGAGEGCVVCMECVDAMNPFEDKR